MSANISKPNDSSAMYDAAGKYIHPVVPRYQTLEGTLRAMEESEGPRKASYTQFVDAENPYIVWGGGDL